MLCQHYSAPAPDNSVPVREPEFPRGQTSYPLVSFLGNTDIETSASSTLNVWVGLIREGKASAVNMIGSHKSL